MNVAANSLGKVNKLSTNAKAKVMPFWKDKQKRALGIKISVLLIILGIIGLGAYRVVQINSGKILPKVKIAGIKVGGKTPAEAKVLVNAYVNQINNSGPQITYEDKTIDTKLPDMGVSFNIDQVVNDAYNIGRSGSAQTKMVDNAKMVFSNYNVSLNPKIDEPKLDEYLGQIAKVVDVAPVNAGLVINDGNISQTPSKEGRGLDKENLKKNLISFINQNKNKQNKIVLTTAVLTPAVLEDGVVNAKADAEQFMLSSPIVLSYNEEVFTASKADVGSWISFNASGNKLVAVVDSGKVGSFASRIASKIEVSKVDREIMDGTGQVLNEGRDGIGVDTKKMVSDLTKRVESSKTGNVIGIGTYLIPKGQVVINPHAQPCRYSGFYVDINLSEQTLYAFDGCTLLNQFLVSTGKTGPTPTGEFHVYGKSRVTRMDGPGYDLPGVEWVSWFSGDYSIHGTYWHNNFGHPMSHGCVNASNANAQWVYERDDIGTPVYIHW